MQKHKGLYKWLSSGWLFRFFQYLVGGDRPRKWIAKYFWKCAAGDKIVDMGCGTGNALDYLPKSVQYVGFDLSKEYIRVAQNRIDQNAQFLVGTASDFIKEPPHFMMGADVVLCNGLLHHLGDDEALEVLRLAKKIMKPSGRLFCVEATFLIRQTRLSKWIVSKDRGMNVRSEQEWKNLVHQIFNSFSTSIATGLIRIPYTHIFIECRNDKEMSALSS